MNKNNSFLGVKDNHVFSKSFYIMALLCIVFVLESHRGTLMATTTATWSSTSNNTWATTSNWAEGVSPNGDYNVTNTSGTTAIVTANATISITSLTPSTSVGTWSVNLQTGTIFEIGTLTLSTGTQIIRSTGSGLTNSVTINTMNISGGTFQTYNGAYTTGSIGSIAISNLNISGGFLLLGAAETTSGTNIGLINFSGTSGKSITLIASGSSDASYTRTITTTGISSAAGTTNASIKGGGAKTGYTNAATLAINTGVGTSYTTNASLQDGTLSTLTVTKSGAGTQILSGSSTYTGGTTISEGMLLAENTTLTNSAVGTGNVLVSSGGIFGGTGSAVLSAGNSVTVASGGALMGGDGTAASGVLTINADLAMQDGSYLKFVVGSTTCSSISRTGGSWTFSTNQAVDFVNAGVQTGVTYTILTGLSSDPGVSSWVISESSWTGTFTYSSGSVNVVFSAIPESKVKMLLLPPLLGLMIYSTLKRSARARMSA